MELTILKYLLTLIFLIFLFGAYYFGKKYHESIPIAVDQIENITNANINDINDDVANKEIKKVWRALINKKMRMIYCYIGVGLTIIIYGFVLYYSGHLLIK